MLLVVILSEIRQRLRRLLLLCTSRFSLRRRFISDPLFRIYNEYMFASSWKIVYYFLRDILREGVTDSTIRTRLTSDEWLRTRYLVLYDIVDTLTALYHTRLSLLATTSRKWKFLPAIARSTEEFLALIAFSSAHFARYFTRNPNYEKGGPEFVFNWSQLKTLQKSFLDSIVVELCLPNSRFPDNILHLLLRDAIDEASKQERRVFPQALWDAIGDLSVRCPRRSPRGFRKT